MKKVLVISAALGSTQTKVIAKQKDFNVDFAFYNDDNFHKRSASFTPRMNAKLLKMLGWKYNPGYDYYIWMDSYFNMTRPDTVKWFIESMGDKDALFFKHPSRNSIIDEAKFMESKVAEGDTYLKNRIKGEPVLDQAKTYCAEDKFKDSFLIAASAFCYSSKLVSHPYNVMEEWFFNVCTGSIRDQISLPYVLQKFGVNFKLIEENVFALKYLK